MSIKNRINKIERTLNYKNTMPIIITVHSQEEADLKIKELGPTDSNRIVIILGGSMTDKNEQKSTK